MLLLSSLTFSEDNHWKISLGYILRKSNNIVKYQFS